MQFPAGYDDYLVESVEDCAAKTLRLLENRELAESFGRAGQAKIRAEFLLPRLIRDELHLKKNKRCHPLGGRKANVGPD